MANYSIHVSQETFIIYNSQQIHGYEYYIIYDTYNIIMFVCFCFFFYLIFVYYILYSILQW